MPSYRRNFVPGGMFFFTVVTNARRPILSQAATVDLLRDAVRETKDHHPFEIIASVILPDHLHMIWSLPPGDARFDQRWSSIKQNFTRRWVALGGAESSFSPARQKEQRRGVWQARYIEHTLGDEEDLERHVHYVHYNPVKHGYVKRPVDWPYSSIHQWIRRGWLASDWAGILSNVDRFDKDINTDLLDP